MPDLLELSPLIVPLAVLLSIPALCALQEWAHAQMQRVLGYRPFLVLSFPGVVAHELAHSTLNVLFLHRIDKINWFGPHPARGNRVTLGFVQYRYNPLSSYQTLGLVVSALAPALLCPLLISGLLSLTGQGEPGTLSLVSAPDFLAASRDWRSGLLLLLCYSVALHSTPSIADYRMAEHGLTLKAGVALTAVVVAGSILWSMLSGWFALDGWQEQALALLGRLGDCWLEGMVFSVVTLLATNALLLLLSVVLLRQAR